MKKLMILLVALVIGTIAATEQVQAQGTVIKTVNLGNQLTTDMFPMTIDVNLDGHTYHSLLGPILKESSGVRGILKFRIGANSATPMGDEISLYPGAKVYAEILVDSNPVNCIKVEGYMKQTPPTPPVTPPVIDPTNPGTCNGGSQCTCCGTCTCCH